MMLCDMIQHDRSKLRLCRISFGTCEIPRTGKRFVYGDVAIANV